MMNLILLGGNHKSNKGWIEDVEREIRHMFDSTLIQYYKHWEEKAANIDFEKEMKELVSNTKGLKKLVFFGKSAGTLLTLKAIYQKVISPEKCIFVGTALNWAKACGLDINNWFESFAVPTLFIQKKDDPAASYDDLYNLLIDKNVRNFRTIKLSGSDHAYRDLKEIRNLIREFICERND